MTDVLIPPPPLTPPPPRRSDDAFARSVVADVNERRQKKTWLMFAAPLAASAAAVALLVMPTTADIDTSPTFLTAADLADPDSDDVIDEVFEQVQLASVDLNDFTFDDLDGSSEQDLVALERALDNVLMKL